MADALPGKVAGEKKKPEAVHSDKSLILRIRTDYLQYEREMDHAHLQDRLEEERIRRTSRRVRFGWLLFVVLVLAAVGIGLGLRISEAVTAHEVVVEPFHAPPNLASSGIDGTLVARGLLDELTRLQRATRGTAARRGLQSAWTNGVHLALPARHISLDAMTAMLKARYGHDLHISGELVESGAGELALTVRADGVAPKSFGGAADELATLTSAAAEYVFGQSEPGLWASYLTGEGRYPETIEFVQAAFPAADRADKPYLLNSWGMALEPTGGSPRDALALYRAALKFKPDYWNAWTNVQSTSINLGDEEGAWQAGEQMRKIANGRPGRAPETDYLSWDLLTGNLQAALSGLMANAAADTGVGALFSSAGTSIADLQARMHDLAAAELTLQTSKDDPNDPTIAAMTHFVRERLAAEAGDTARAVTEMEAFAVAAANPAAAADITGYNCWFAPAEEAAGHPDKADAILLSAGTIVDCYRFHADILDGRGDWTGARKAYAAAVNLAPDLPAAYCSWGLALARHGDLPGAAEKFKQANLRGPHWADPLKAWGDVLLKQRQVKEAVAKYDEALKYAPNWVALREATFAAQHGR